MKSLGDDSMPMDTDKDDGMMKKESAMSAKSAPPDTVMEKLKEMEAKPVFVPQNEHQYEPDNVELQAPSPLPVKAG